MNNHKAIIAILMSTIGVCLVFLIIAFASEAKRQEQVNKDPWNGVEREQVIGTTLDTCRCTIINDKLYRVNIQVKQHHTFTEIKKQVFKRQEEINNISSY